MKIVSRVYKLLLILMLSLFGYQALGAPEEVINTAPRAIRTTTDEITIKVTSNDLIQKKYFSLKKENNTVVSDQAISGQGYSVKVKQTSNINSTYMLTFKTNKNQPSCTITFQVGPNTKIMDQDCNYQLVHQGTTITLKP